MIPAVEIIRKNEKKYLKNKTVKRIGEEILEKDPDKYPAAVIAHGKKKTRA